MQGPTRTPHITRAVSCAFTVCPSLGGRKGDCQVKQARTTTSVCYVQSQQSEGLSAHKVRKLILLRHAESDMSSRVVRDHDRALTEEGKKEAAAISAKLKAAGWVPDLVLASNAKRTKQTLEFMTDLAPELEAADAHFYGSLYTVAATDGHTREHLSECILEVVDDDRNVCVMCVGSNKGWEEAASEFSKKEVRLKTACAALLQSFSDSWKESLSVGHEWQLVGVLSPSS